jgi:hypothetical protein
MVAKLRLLAALGALVTALVVAWQSAPPANVGTPKVQLRSTAAPMDPPTTMKSPIVATTDPSPFNPCQDIPFDVVQRLGLAFTPPEPEEGLRCHYDAGNYQLAVEPIIWRNYDQSLPADAVETTVNGHCRPVLEPQAHVSQQLLVHVLHGDLQDQLRGHPAVAVLLDGLLQPRGRLSVHQPAAGKRPFALLQVLSPRPLPRP